MWRLLLVLLIAFPAAAQPRAIDPAEREAVTVAAAFLADGPRALWSRLAPDAPLRLLGETDALRELAVRTGPREGARWTLRTAAGEPGSVAFQVRFPSGYEDGLLFRMKRAGNRWFLQEVLTLAEPLDRPPAPPAPAKPSADRRLVIAALVVAILAVFFRGKLKAVVALVAVALLAVALLPRFAKPERKLPFVQLRELAALRAQLARGDAPRLPAGVSGEARDVARLWILQSGAPAEMPANAATQLSELVKARIALTKDKQDEARLAFERALAIRPLRDDILLEAVKSLDTFRPDSRVDGSRDAELYYARAVQHAIDGKVADGQRDLLTAWKLRPRTREELVRDPRLFALLHDVRMMANVSLLSAQEPVVRSPTAGTAPIALPPNAASIVCGEFLRVTLGDASLDVPGGGALAAKDTRVVPATYWTEEEDAAALRDAGELLEVRSRSKTPANTLAARTRVVRAAEALAHHNRWGELLRLTDDIGPDDESAPPELLPLRLRALLRAERADEARALATGEAVRRLARQKTHPAAVVMIADAMTSTGAYDAALPLYEALRGNETLAAIVEARIRQLQLRQALAQSGLTIATAHFDVRHDPKMNPAIASRIGDLLEAELARVRAKLPPLQPRRITANVLFWEDFRDEITGSDHIVGLYDGEILFPFATVEQFRPDVVSTITHEMTHALVAQATGDNAPRWFQEGLAQRMELVPVKENAFYDNSPLLVLPLPLLDAVMENGIDSYAIEQGYKVAHTFVRFLESRYGAKGIATLIAEFAKGRNTDDAIRALTGKSLDALNHDFREWGFANNGNFHNDAPWPYRDFYSPDVDPRVRQGFTWRKKQQ